MRINKFIIINNKRRKKFPLPLAVIVKKVTV